MINRMSRTEYIRCPNPRCGKLNPAQPEEGREYTCVFCGQPFTPPAKSTQTTEASFKKRSRGKKPLNPSEVKPENRNMKKPMI